MKVVLKHLISMSLLVCLGFAGTACTSDEEVAAEEVVEVSDEDVAEAPIDATLDAPAFDPSSVTVYFGFDEASLSAEAQSQLAATVDALKNNANLKIQVEGHCDERGSIEYNLALGERRATAVKEYLLSMGVSDVQVTTVSLGEEQLADTSATEEAHAKNRRAAFGTLSH
jgi:peptidoglycan-associated lipoprotein